MKAILRAGSGWLWMLLPLLLVGCQSGNRPLLADKQGYYTWVDASGQLHSSPIQRTEQTSAEAGPSDKALAERHTTAAVPASTPDSGEPSEQPDAPAPGSGAPSDQHQANPVDSGDTPLTQTGDGRSTSNSDDSEYTLANYPDAEALEKAGYIRPGDPLPYYTWQDSEGRIRVSYYRPDTRTDVEKGLIRQPVELTDASVYTADTEPTAVTPPLSDGEVPEAFRVMGIDPRGGTLFQRWQVLCCQSLTVSQVQEWSSDREFQLDMDESAPDHRFSTGVSHYRLVELPSSRLPGGFVVRIRSFDDHGVFVPSVAFLDKNLTPVRLVTDLVMEFQPESWHRQGYLEAFVPVFPARGERWLLVFTRAEDLASQTVTETRHGPRRVSHEPTGTLSLTEMRP